MTYIKEMLETHPLKPSGSHDDLLEGLSALWSCAEACHRCERICKEIILHS